MGKINSRGKHEGKAFENSHAIENLKEKHRGKTHCVSKPEKNTVNYYIGTISTYVLLINLIYFKDIKG